MKHELLFEATSLPLLLFLSLLSSSPAAIASAADPKIGDCVPKRCGDLANVSYPFWINGQQPSYCGFPQFKLNCDKNTTASLPGGYLVRDIFYANQSLLVVADTNTDCSLLYYNLTFSLTSFSISTANRELFFLYNCTEWLRDGYYRVPCANHDTFSYLGGLYNPLDLEHPALSSACETLIVPVLGYSGANGSDYDKLVKDGFLLDWIVANCSDCRESHGQCGFNTSSETFMCICPDRTHSRSCRKTSSATKKRRIISIVLGAVGGLLAVCLVCFLWYNRGKIGRRSSSSKFLIRSVSSKLESSMKDDAELGGSTSYHTHVFSYAELQEATNGFDESKELGDGGFGTVYKGHLKDGRVVAVKRLYENNYKRVEQFLNEVDILSRLRHQNLVTLYGCTSRHSRELLLVYEFINNGTVADHLHGHRASEKALTWPVRLNIAIETADALGYLHAIEPQIIHRDVKTNNILLDNSFHVKVADFGLSRLFPIDATHVSTLPQGTPGYVDPEYHQCYQLTDKSDVYSFGVVLVELISSKPAVDITRHRHEINLASFAINKIQNREIDKLIDPELGYQLDWEMERMITMVAELAFRCLQGDGDMRPSIKEALVELRGIQNRGEKGVEAADVQISDDARLLKNILPYSPDSVTVRWDSRSTTPNTSS